MKKGGVDAAWLGENGITFKANNFHGKIFSAIKCSVTVFIETNSPKKVRHAKEDRNTKEDRHAKKNAQTSSFSIYEGATSTDKDVTVTIISPSLPRNKPSKEYVETLNFWSNVLLGMNVDKAKKSLNKQLIQTKPKIMKL